MEAVRRLLRLSVKALDDGIHNHIGSQALWTQHKEAVDRMIDKLDAFQLTEVKQTKKKIQGLVRKYFILSVWGLEHIDYILPP